MTAFAYLSAASLCAVALTGRWWAAVALVALLLIRTPAKDRR